MRIVAISDVHEQWAKLDLPAGDILVIAGDLCERRDASFKAADAWLASVRQSYKWILYTPGNHDHSILDHPGKYRSLAPNLLKAMTVDETVQFEGLRFHSMPWESKDRANREAAIPDAVDVLVTHEPPEGIRDWSPRSSEDRLGNRALRQRVAIIKPRIHIFGHCHMAYGVEHRGQTTFANVAICGDPKKYYRAAHPATIVDIDGERLEVTQWR